MNVDNSFLIPVQSLSIGNHIRLPISAVYEPLSDITAYELSLLLPYLLQRPFYEEDWAKLGDAARHLKRL